MNIRNKPASNKASSLAIYLQVFIWKTTLDVKLTDIGKNCYVSHFLQRTRHEIKWSRVKRPKEGGQNKRVEIGSFTLSHIPINWNATGFVQFFFKLLTF